MRFLGKFQRRRRGFSFRGACLSTGVLLIAPTDRSAKLPSTQQFDRKLRTIMRSVNGGGVAIIIRPKDQSQTFANKPIPFRHNFTHLGHKSAHYYGRANLIVRFSFASSIKVNLIKVAAAVLVGVSVIYDHH